MGPLDGKPLAGRVALVTGASRGIGKDVCISLGRAGAQVVAMARTEQEGESRIPGTLNDTVRMVKEAGGEAVAVKGDVTMEEDVARVVKTAVDTFGKLDILVNNAGILIPGNTLEVQIRHFDLIYRVNVKGPYLMMRAAVPEMRKAGGGHIVNISSQGAIGPGPGPYVRPPLERGPTIYGSTKKSLERLTQGLAWELYNDNISVNALSPDGVHWSEGGHFFRTQGGTRPAPQADRAGGTPLPYERSRRPNARILGDTIVLICMKPPKAFTGQILYDEEFMLKHSGLTPEEVFERYPVEK
jgi:NAD(P)-dependent dehydrogenase (short-subunit alcohol dehydrogenase family)